MSVVVRAIRGRIKLGMFDSEAELLEYIDDEIHLISSSKGQLIDSWKTSAECAHSFGSATYTIQGRLIGYEKVYSRTCSKCGYEDTHSHAEDNPEWCSAAEEVYYNNFI